MGRWGLLVCGVVLLCAVSVILLPLVVRDGPWLYVSVFGVPLILLLAFAFSLWRLQNRGVPQGYWFGAFTPLVAFVVVAVAFCSAYKAAAEMGFQVCSDSVPCEKSLYKLFYFSVITAGTLGYGDYIPAHDVTRFLVCAEVIELWLFAALAFYVMNECVKGNRRLLRPVTRVYNGWSSGKGPGPGQGQGP